MGTGRHARQLAFAKLGAEGQARLAGSRVAVIGVGGLGTVAAQALCRAGVGFVRLVDRDYVEESNLPRQVLYDEADVREGLPKAVAAARRLGAVDSSIALEARVVDVDASNVDDLVRDVDLVIDGGDNFAVRFLVNEACLARGVPWIYGGALGDYGVTMNVLPGRGPCLRCLLRECPPPGSLPSCAEAGVLNMATGVIGNIQAAEGLKLLLGSPDLRRTYLSVSLWKSRFHELALERDPGCPSCGDGDRHPPRLERDSLALALCGRDSVQLSPAGARELDFEALAARLGPLGEVRRNEYMLSFAAEGREIRVFRDGRAIVSKVRDEGEAKSFYAEYIGF